MENKNINWEKMSFTKLKEKQEQIEKQNKDLKKKNTRRIIEETMILVLIIMLFYYVIPMLAKFWPNVEFLVSLKTTFKKMFGFILVVPISVFLMSKMSKQPLKIVENNKKLKLIQEFLEKKK